MKKILVFLIGTLSVWHLNAQNTESILSEMAFFKSIDGTWEGMPEDSSFVSVLKYQKGNKEHFVSVDNDLFSKERKHFSHYEGVYFFNPSTSRIEYTTINKSEIHSGYCKVSKDTLFHYATVKNKAGNTRAYASAIVKIDSKTLAYYAVYGKDEKIPELVFKNPLIYRNVSYEVSSEKTDTLKVYQNDTSLFYSKLIPTRPCSKPRAEFSYELKNPKENTYYLIFNQKGQLVEEGFYTSKHIIDGTNGGFYNSKYYYYKNNGKLSRVYHEVDGKTLKVEYYKNGKLKEIKHIAA